MMIEKSFTVAGKQAEKVGIAQGMKVLLLTDSPAFAGTERHILDLCQGLQAAGAQPMIGCPEEGLLAARAKSADIELVAVPAKNYVVTMLMKLVGLLRSNRIDLIHAHNGVSHLIAATAIQISGRGKCVATHHFLSPKRTVRRGLSATMANAAHKFALGKTSHFIAISKAVAKSCEPLSPGVPTTVALNGIPPAPAVGRAPEQIRLEQRIPEGAFLIVSAARLEPEKNLDVLTNAMKSIAQEHPDCICLIAGEGSQLEYLNKLIENLGLSPNVRMIGFQNDAISLINAADVFVLPSSSEPLGLVILEAMAVETPVIAANAGGPPELIDDGRNGLLFASGDHQSLAHCIDRLLRNRDLAHSIAVEGRKSVEGRFNVSAMTEKIATVYKTALQGANSAVAQS